MYSKNERHVSHFKQDAFVPEFAQDSFRGQSYSRGGKCNGSRRKLEKGDWKLHGDIFDMLDQVWGPRTMDWTASQSNTQLPRFCSWMFDQEATCIDVLKSLHPRENGFSNPPFSLIGRILQLVRIRKVTMSIVAPVWRSQPWWPVLTSMCVDDPIMLSDKTTLQHVFHHHHHHPQHIFIPPDYREGMTIYPPAWEVAAFRISGKASRSRAFQRRL